MALPYTVTLLEQCQVSPPPASVPQTSLPLSFFDLHFIGLSPVRNLYFYEFQHPKTHFMESILPNIKHSLSLTLQHFFPLAGHLTWLPNSTKPEIRYIDGDFVLLTVAECNYDFNHLSANHARPASEFYPLVPPMPNVSDTQVVEYPLLALQVTLFPNSGICIGVTISHVAADGLSSIHFIKSWASICKLGGENYPLVLESLPFYDRTVIKDPKGLETIYLNELSKRNVSQQNFKIPNIPNIPIDTVLTTFVMGPLEIEKLKQWVLNQLEISPSPLHLSKLVLTCALFWVCLTKTRGGGDVVYIDIAMDCRTRLDHPIPITYFGNCLMPCFIGAKRNDLIGEDGIAIAAKTILNSIKRMNEGVLENAENFFTILMSMMSDGAVVIAGSPKLGVYEMDFGWGTPKKVEVTSIDSGAMYVCESRDGEGGVEFSLALNKLEMDAFASHFNEILKNLP